MSLAKEFALGGETKRHESKIFSQNLRKLLLSCLVIGGLLAGTWNYITAGPLKRRYLLAYGWSYAFTKHPGAVRTKKNPFQLDNDSRYWIPTANKPPEKETPYRTVADSGSKSRLLSWPNGKPVIEWRGTYIDTGVYAYLKKYIYQNKSFPALLTSFFLQLLIIATVAGAFQARSWIKTGKEKMRDRFIRGTQAVHPKVLNRMIRKARLHGGLKLGEVWVPKGTENHHFLFVGMPRSGKTTAMFQLLWQLRNLQTKVLVFDYKGDFIKTFYNPETDIILNPFDQRSVKYTLWSEGRDIQTLESVAESLVQENYGSANRFFVDAAQAVIADVAALGARQGKTSNRWFWQTVLQRLGDLSSDLEGTEGGAHMDPTGERTAHSVRSTVLNHVRIFKYLPDPEPGEKPFSMREWVRSNRPGWAFACIRPKYKKLLRSFISLLFDQAAVELLEMPDLDPGEPPRLWMFIDEFFTLQKLPNAQDLATLGSRGCAAALGIQLISQIRSIYGTDEADSLTGYCGHHLFLRNKEPKTQQWCQDALGSAEYFQVSEGISMADTDRGDHSSRSEQRKEIPSVLKSQFKDLPDRVGYLSLSGPLPITVTEIPKQPRPQNHPDFIPRKEIDLAAAVAESNENNQNDAGDDQDNGF